MKSEINLNVTRAFHATMLKIKPGAPGDHLMQLALSTKPFGPSWPRIDFKQFPERAASPSISTHLDVIFRTLRGERLPWKPDMELIKGLRTLTFLLKRPEMVATHVDRLAREGTVAQKAAAKALL